jgi:hypothetical protein
VALWMTEHLQWSRARVSEEVQRIERLLDAEERVISSSPE